MGACNKEKKLRLWRKDRRCRNCGVITVIPNEHTDTPPANMATIQHKYDRLHPERISGSKEGRTIYLWCLKCNQDYNFKHEKDRSQLNAAEIKKQLAPEEIITDSEISSVWGDAWLGDSYNQQKRVTINNLIIMYLSEKHLGQIGIGILNKLNIVSPYGKLTIRGKDYLVSTFYQAVQSDYEAYLTTNQLKDE